MSDGLLCLRFSPQLSAIGLFDDWLSGVGVPLIRKGSFLQPVVLHGLGLDAPQAVRGAVRRALLLFAARERFQEALDSDALEEFTTKLSTWGDWFNDLDGEDYTGSVYERALGTVLDPATLGPTLVLERFAAEEVSADFDRWLEEEYVGAVSEHPAVTAVTTFVVSTSLLSPSATHYSPGSRLVVTTLEVDPETVAHEISWLAPSLRWDLVLPVVTREAYAVDAISNGGELPR